MDARVVALWRYPVKSMMGEEVNASDITERGLAGDRAFGLIDAETGKLASAKNPRKWRRLFEFRAGFLEQPRDGEPLPAARITFPDGANVSTDDADLDDRLSEELGRRVRLATTAPQGLVAEDGTVAEMEGGAVSDFPASAAAPPGTFFDLAAIHVLTTASLARIQELVPSTRFEARRFRPNIVVDVPGADGFVENDWANRVLAVGEARLRVLIPVPRCVMTTLPQGDLPRDADVLRSLSRHNAIALGDRARPCLGVYAEVVSAGTVRRGDAVSIE